MDELHRSADKFFAEVDHLERMLDADEMSDERIRLALASAKRVRRESNLVVRALARLRDQLQP